jgi:hypothetical protein
MAGSVTASDAGFAGGSTGGGAVGGSRSVSCGTSEMLGGATSNGRGTGFQLGAGVSGSGRLRRRPMAGRGRPPMEVVSISGWIGGASGEPAKAYSMPANVAGSHGGFGRPAKAAGANCGGKAGASRLSGGGTASSRSLGSGPSPGSGSGGEGEGASGGERDSEGAGGAGSGTGRMNRVGGAAASSSRISIDGLSGVRSGSASIGAASTSGSGRRACSSRISSTYRSSNGAGASSSTSACILHTGLSDQVFPHSRWAKDRSFKRMVSASTSFGVVMT